MNAKQMLYQSRAEGAPRTWDPLTGGKRSWVCFDDFKTYNLGPDSDGIRFNAMSDRMMSGSYYPADALSFGGQFREEGRTLQPGDRIVQDAPVLGRLGGPHVHFGAEIFVAESADDRCKIGYVTTSVHFARGIWSAELVRKDGLLHLTVQSTASPGSWLFWLGLPYVRFLQLRARWRAVEELQRL